jgi:hypothetical protein
MMTSRFEPRLMELVVIQAGVIRYALLEETNEFMTVTLTPLSWDSINGWRCRSGGLRASECNECEFDCERV